MRGLLSDLLWDALFVVILLGGIGMAMYNTDIPLQTAMPMLAIATPSGAAIAPTSPQDGCSDGGCTADPGTRCGKPAIRAVVQGEERFYFVAGDLGYAYHATLRPEQGDRWFCTAAQAGANGFRPAK